jgi:hypothetical protein
MSPSGFELAILASERPLTHAVRAGARTSESWYQGNFWRSPSYLAKPWRLTVTPDVSERAYNIHPHQSIWRLFPADFKFHEHYTLVNNGTGCARMRSWPNLKWVTQVMMVKAWEERRRSLSVALTQWLLMSHDSLAFPCPLLMTIMVVVWELPQAAELSVRTHEIKANLPKTKIGQYCV